MTGEKKEPIDRVVQPIQRFMLEEKSEGILLRLSVIIAMILANFPWSEDYSHVLGHKLGFIFDGILFFEYSIHH